MFRRGPPSATALRCRRLAIAASVAASVALGLGADAASSELLRIGGAGAGLGPASILGTAFANDEPRGAVAFEFVPSLGSTGGIEATLDGAVEVGVSLRRLNEEEVGRGAREAACFGTPLVVVTSHPHPPGLRRDEIAPIYAAPKAIWSDGRPLKIILRPKVDFEMMFADSSFPGIEAALATARQRPDVPVAATDQDNLDLARRIPGSLTLATLAQLSTEGTMGIRAVALDGVAPNMDAFLRGAYPLAETLCLVLPLRPAAVATRFIGFLGTPAAQQLLRSVALLPVERDERAGALADPNRQAEQPGR
jgi:phosphate transport system substrate-binding protein